MAKKSPNFSGEIVSGLFWVACGKGIQSLLQFLVLIILARLISPEDFGIVAAAMIVIGFSAIITELGFGSAVVQRKNLEPRHLHTAFFVSLVFTISAGIIIYFAAPLIADFFDSKQVEPVLRVLALLFPLNGIATVGDALAQREMRFRWLATRDAFAFGIGYFIFGVGPALLGYGVWSLVAATLVTALLKTTLLLKDYPPKSIKPERKAFFELLHFGGGHTLARISSFAALQGDNLVIGRALGLSALGIYGRAYQLMSVPATVLGQILDKVLFPSMSKIQDQKERLAATYFRSINLIALVMLPISVGGFIVAPEIVGLLLGEQWTEVILPFRILLIGLLMRTSYKLSDSLTRASGEVYRRAWRQGVYAALVIGGAWFGHFWDVAGVAAGVLAAVSINFLLMAQMSLSVLKESWINFANAHLHALFFAATTGAVVYPTVYFLRLFDIPHFLVLAGTGFVLIIFLFLTARYVPLFFFGKEGVQMLNLLQMYLPKWLRLNSLSKYEKSSINNIGVKDKGIESI